MYYNINYYDMAIKKVYRKSHTRKFALIKELTTLLKAHSIHTI